MIRKLLTVTMFILISLSFFSLCFAAMRLPADWRFKTSFSLDWRFQNAEKGGVVRIYKPYKIMRLYDRYGKVTTLYEKLDNRKTF